MRPFAGSITNCFRGGPSRSVRPEPEMKANVTAQQLHLPYLTPLQMWDLNPPIRLVTNRVGISVLTSRPVMAAAERKETSKQSVVRRDRCVRLSGDGSLDSMTTTT